MIKYTVFIFFRAIKEIVEDTELLVWYGNDYAKELGILAQQTQCAIEEALTRKLFPTQSQIQQQPRGKLMHF